MECSAIISSRPDIDWLPKVGGNRDGRNPSAEIVAHRKFYFVLTGSQFEFFRDPQTGLESPLQVVWR